MKQVIDGKLYNTETAERLHWYEPYDDTGNFHYIFEELYQTKRGSLFLAGHGGPMSAYSESLGGGSYGGGEGIRPLSKAEAIEWLEQTGGTQALLEHFQADIEEA